MEDGYKKLHRIMKTKITAVDNKNCVMIGFLLNNNLCTTLHSLMFELTVRYLSDDEQVEKWLPKIIKCQMIGNYC